MKKCLHISLYIFLSVVLLSFKIHAHARYQQYQDVLINNIVVQKGAYDCQRRYEVLKPILDQYKRPITVLDIGAGQGYFSFRIAHDYDSTCIMIQDNHASLRLGDQLLELCYQNTSLQNVALLQTRLPLPDLETLADCEHFDVVLAFDALHANDSDWKRRADAILRLGDNIFIASPWSNGLNTLRNGNINNIGKYLAQQNGTLLLQTPCECIPKAQEQLFWFQRPKNGLRCHRFDLPAKDSNIDLYRIESSFSYKALYKAGCYRAIPWIKGINLVTFLMLDGVYPTKDYIKQSICNKSQEKLTDFVPWNMIIQGNCIALIDQNDAKWRSDVAKSIGYTFGVIDQSSQADMLHLLSAPEYRKWRVRRHK